MHNPYSGYPTSRNPFAQNRNFFEPYAKPAQVPVQNVPTDPSLATPVPSIPPSPGGFIPGLPQTEFLQQPGSRSTPPHVHGAPIPIPVPAPGEVPAPIPTPIPMSPQRQSPVPMVTPLPTPSTAPGKEIFPAPSEFPIPPMPPGSSISAQPIPKTGTTPIPGYKKGWDVSQNVHTIYPDGEQHPTQISGLTPIVIPEAPYFAVPTNPLLPDQYHEVISYEGLQYLNGFLRTQIGKFCYIEFLFGSSDLATRYGILVGVGINYILLENPTSHELTVCDFYSIRYVDFINVESIRNRFQPSV